MNSKLLAAAFAVLLLSSIAVAPAAAAPGDQGDECENADEGPSDGGPPGFVGGLVDSVTPEFLSDLFADLPAPGFVKGFFGAESGC